MTTITSEELKQLQDAGQKVLAQYTAVFCGPCRALTPKLANMSNEFENVTFVKIDVEQNPDLTQELEIRSVPTVIVYNGNDIVDRTTGVQPDAYYKKVLNSL
jgi:thioredoxin 1